MTMSRLLIGLGTVIALGFVAVGTHAAIPRDHHQQQDSSHREFLSQLLTSTTRQQIQTTTTEGAIQVTFIHFVYIRFWFALTCNLHGK